MRALSMLCCGPGVRGPARGRRAGRARGVVTARGRRRGGRHATGSELPKNYLGVLDHLYARAIVLDNGAAAAALVTVDAGMRSRTALANGVAADRKGARHSRDPRAADRHAHAQPGRPARSRLRAEDRRGGPPREAAARAGPRWLRDRRVVHQRQPADHRSEDRPVVGRPQPRRAIGQDGGGGEVRNDDR